MMTANIPKPSARNVLRIFRAGTADDVTNGRDWYRRAHDAAREVAETYLNSTDTDAIERVACVYAAISPTMPWQRNDQLARRAFALASDGATFDDIVDGLGMLKANARKAAAIVLGADPWSVLSGPKVIPFAQRIADAASGTMGPSSVVIDRHAHDIALGRMTDDATRSRNLARKGGQRAFAMAYVRAAETLRRTGEAPGITPAELQAVTWVVWRREHGHSQARALSRAESRTETQEG
jgi:hypothetical protein